jgi:hypothetical protein
MAWRAHRGADQMVVEPDRLDEEVVGDPTNRPKFTW